MAPLGEVRSSLKEGTVVGSFVEAVRKVPDVVGEVMWLQLGEGEVRCREEKLRQCLVGWFEEASDLLPDFSWMRNLVTNLWSVKGAVKIFAFNGALLLFNFDDSFEVEKVLARSARRLKEKFLHLIRWHLDVWRLLNGEGFAKELWVRM